MFSFRARPSEPPLLNFKTGNLERLPLTAGIVPYYPPIARVLTVFFNKNQHERPEIRGGQQRPKFPDLWFYQNGKGCYRPCTAFNQVVSANPLSARARRTGRVVVITSIPAGAVIIIPVPAGGIHIDYQQTKHRLSIPLVV